MTERCKLEEFSIRTPQSFCFVKIQPPLHRSALPGSAEAQASLFEGGGFAARRRRKEFKLEESSNFQPLRLLLLLGDLLSTIMWHLQGKPLFQVFPEPLSSASQKRSSALCEARVRALPRHPTTFEKVDKAFTFSRFLAFLNFATTRPFNERSFNKTAKG